MNWFKTGRKAKIRRYMRGYNRLLKEDRPEYIAKIRNEIANYPITGESTQKIFKSNINICYHQFLMYRLINLNFNKAILEAIVDPKNRVYYPLPYLWRTILIKEGFKVPVLMNTILWIKFNLKWFFFGLAEGLLLIINLSNNKNSGKGSSSVFFENLTPENLIKNPNKYSKNIVEWFTDQEEAITIETIYHSCKLSPTYEVNKKRISYKPHALPLLNFGKKWIKFTLWLFKNSCIALFKQRNRLLFRQLVFEKIAKLSKYDELCSIYFFHNSVNLLRPLWTYEAEKKGSQIIFYFYSTNILSLKENNKPHVQDNQWQIVNWPNYWVWNKAQEIFLKSIVCSPFKTIIKGIIPFSSSNQKNNFSYFNKKKFILIFDVQPIKKHIYASLAPTVEYYSENQAIVFLNLIDELATHLNINVLIKRKRNNPFTSKKYLNKLSKFLSTDRWDEINPETDASYICANLAPIASISVPFTSTAIISKSNKIPTVYLDHTGKLDKNFHSVKDIPLLSSKEELYNWLEVIINKI